MDIGEWLQRIGLEQYEPAFRNNEIDKEILPKLTADDLEDLGVAIVGHRRKMLTTISELSAPPAAPAHRAPAGRGSRVIRGGAPPAHCHVLRSGRFDRALGAPRSRGHARSHRAYQNAARASWRGTADSSRDSWAMASGLFRLSRAHENDAERAVAPGSPSGTPHLETPASNPDARVGIATGIVIVGEVGGFGEAQDGPSSATRPTWRRACKPPPSPTVAIAEGTRNLIGDLFEVEALRPPELKGVEGRVRASAVLRESSQESRFEALRAGALHKPGRP